MPLLNQEITHGANTRNPSLMMETIIDQAKSVVNSRDSRQDFEGQSGRGTERPPMLVIRMPGESTLEWRCRPYLLVVGTQDTVSEDSVLAEAGTIHADIPMFHPSESDTESLDGGAATLPSV